jgi:large subunit ribosomal protein L5
MSPATLRQSVVPTLMEGLGRTNPLAVPRIVKVVVASGVGKIRDNEKGLEEVARTLTTITGQKPKQTLARKAIASFKVRKGAPVGFMVTLRGKRMEDFLRRLVHVVLPRIRDFRGLSRTGFDEQGNFSVGISEQIVFPEVSPDSIQALHGLEITIVTTAKTPQEGQALLAAWGFPFKKEES